MPDGKSKLTLWGIEVFVATAEEKSISAAARRLHTSPATVSQQLTNLETLMGTQLLDRSSRPMNMTPAGQLFRKRANTILNEAEHARAELVSSGMGRLTQFRLGVIEDFDANVTPQLLISMAQEFDQCKFLLETGASHRLFDLLDSRGLDAIIAADLGAQAEWMEVHPVMREPFVAVVPLDFPMGDGVEAELKTTPLIQYTTRHHMGRQVAEHLARQNLMLTHRYELDSYHSIMAMVAGGEGWTITTPLAWLHARRFNKTTKMIPLPFAPLTRTISLNARRDILGEMPTNTARYLREILTDTVVRPAVADQPWLKNQLVVL